MQYFLVAPLSTTSVAPATPRAPHATSSLSMRSRADYVTSELEQQWTPLEAPEPGIDRAWIVSLRGRQLLVAEASLTTAITRGSVTAVEEQLSDLVTSFVAARPELEGSTPLWVGRTLLLPAKKTVPAGWLDASASLVALDGDASDVDVHLGWGNNAIVGWTGDVGDSRVLRGIIDAQYLWVDIENLSSVSSASVHGVADSSDSRTVSYRRELSVMEDVSRGLARHNLAYDDVLMHVQGAQRAVTVALLKSWNYEDVRARISRRIADTTRILEQRESRQERRYQGLVETILFGLALAAFLELVFVAISASYDALESESHGRHSPIGIFAWIRETESDYLILGAVALIGLMVAAVGVVRFRRR